MRKVFKITGEAARKAICRETLVAPEGYVVTIAEPSRNLDQNAAQWPILEVIAQQVEWQVNGKAQYITPEDWKDILTCAFRNEVPRVAMGLSGGMVLLGQRTSKFNKREFSDWLEWLHAFCADRGVALHRVAE